ncbi:DUF2218 domain-containing protein [Thalassococcus lentus]|uniref:DUF2218 domain-containing protein n=1 Tax=Thalassococcus lentus TaxID=1210524 RepID=A0ABT4XUP4_9RHOB|nr:DUF2218 domain-containing protein [Thalassococcus lentus]MDA7425689.1 DUF2218 domain-containing protein [Thalassococcus lentus]
MNATANFETEYAARYLANLCKHFARRIPTTHQDTFGTVEFPFGRCQMSAHQNRLTLEAFADDATGLGQVTELVTRHLERFAFRENPLLDWQLNTGSSPEIHSPRKDTL